MSPIWFPGMVHAGDFDPVGRGPRRGPALLIVVAVIGSAIALRLAGRLWVCSCGEVNVWNGDIWSAQNSQQLFDPYTLTHVLHGVLFAWMLLRVPIAPAWRLAVAVSAEALWEVVENSRFVIERYRAATISLGYTGDTIVNSMGDIAACAVGFLLMRYLGVRRSIYLFVGVELLLLVWIRDSLLLNIIMLLFPVEAVRNWQMG